MIQGFFKEQEEKYHQAWARSSSDDKEEREEVYRLSRTLKSFKDSIESYIQEGKISQQALKDINRDSF